MPKFILRDIKNHEWEKIDPLYQFDEEVSRMRHPSFIGSPDIRTPYIDIKVNVNNSNILLIEVEFDPSDDNDIKYIKENLINHYCNGIIERANELLLERTDIKYIDITIKYHGNTMQEREYSIGEKE